MSSGSFVEGVRSLVRDTIVRHSMVSPGDVVLLGVSGGPDSMCLLDCLLYLAPEFDMRLWVGHLHHGMRGPVADRDARLVCEFASARGVPVTVEKQDVPGIALRRGVGLEEAGRIARYSFLENLARCIGATKIATAHSMNDQAETVLMRLLRGSGTAGLAGIPPVREEIVRPLIRVTRRQIEQYVSERNLPTVRDVYNFDVRYTRNKVRHELIPFLEREFNRSVVDALAHAATLLRWDEEFLDALTSADFRSHSYSEGRLTFILRNVLASQHPAVSSRMVRKAFSEVLGGYGLPDSRSVEALLNGLNEQHEKVYNLGRGVRARAEGDWVAFFPPPPKNLSVKMKVPGSVDIPELGVTIRTWFPPEEESLRLKEEILSGNTSRTRTGRVRAGGIFLERRVFVDYNDVKRGLRGDVYLVVRTRKPGDRMCPLGMGGRSKKIQDLFVSVGLSRWCRDFIPIIERDGDIVWVAGIRLDERFKVDDDTRVLLAMEVEPSLRRTADYANIRESLT